MILVQPALGNTTDSLIRGTSRDQLEKKDCGKDKIMAIKAIDAAKDARNDLAHNKHYRGRDSVKYKGHTNTRNNLTL